MRRIFYLVLASFATCNGQTIPYGPNPIPFSATANAFKPPINPVTSTVLPVGSNPYNNPYYRHQPSAAANVPILTFSNTQDGQGSYAFSFTTGDGKQVQENGYLKDAYIDNAGEPQGTQVVQGSYAYIAPDGTPIEVTYVADENGFRPSGVHIPSNGKAAPLPLPFSGGVGKDGKPNAVDPYYNRYNAHNRYDPYYHNNARNYYGNNRYDPYNYNNNLYDSSRYYQNDSRYNPNWHNSYPGFVPLSQTIKPKEDSKRN